MIKFSNESNCQLNLDIKCLKIAEKIGQSMHIRNFKTFQLSKRSKRINERKFIQGLFSKRNFLLPVHLRLLQLIKDRVKQTNCERNCVCRLIENDPLKRDRQQSLIWLLLNLSKSKMPIATMTRSYISPMRLLPIYLERRLSLLWLDIMTVIQTVPHQMNNYYNL